MVELAAKDISIIKIARILVLADVTETGRSWKDDCNEFAEDCLLRTYTFAFDELYNNARNHF